MPKLTPGNKLYLYKLLRSEIGTGKQTLLSRVEEVLVADDLAPQDLGFSSVRELVESMGDMVKLTVFKKGNAYATLLPNAEWDRLLAKPAAPSAQQKAAAKGKPWKHRTKAKALKPAKPRHVRRKEPAAAPGDSTAAAQGAPEGTDVTGGKGARAPEAPATPPAGGDTSPAAAAEATGGPEGPAHQAGAALGAQPWGEPPSESEAAEAARLESLSEELDEAAPTARLAGDEGPEAAREAEVLPLEEVIEAARPKVPPTHHIKLTVTYDPYAGIEREIAATEKNLSEAVLESTRRQAQPAGHPEDVPGAHTATRAVGTAPAPDDATATGANPPEAGTTPQAEAQTPRAALRKATAEARPQATTPGSEPIAEGLSSSQATARSGGAATPEPVPAPQTAPTSPAAPEPQIPPAPERQFELLDEAEEATVVPEPILVGLPRDFEAEVYVPNGPLSLLYQLLPPDENPNQLLAADWQVARSTRSYGGTRNLVTFPLRLSHKDGSPVRVTMRRTRRPASGRHWAVMAVDGNDGSGPLTEDADPSGLPDTDTAVERLLARNVELGPWDEALAALANVAAPEDWDFGPGRGDRSILRLYLALTWRAVLEQRLLAETSEGSFAAFDTGLLSPLSEHVYACLEGCGAEAPWRLLGFSTTGEGELGDRLATLDALPHAPRYLGSFGDLAIEPGDTVELPRRVARTLGDDADELASSAVLRCAADWRLVAPGVDVDSGDFCLLLPLGTSSDPTQATRALCVSRNSDGTLRARGVHGLARAYVEARVVGRSLPAWLSQAAVTAEIAQGSTKDRLPEASETRE